MSVITERNAVNRQTYPVGTVIWHMAGYRHGGNIYWSAKPDVIEVRNPGGFWLDVLPKSDAAQGNTWNNIGASYFLSREECLAHWGDRSLIEPTGEPVDVWNDESDDDRVGEYEVEADVIEYPFYISVERVPFDPGKLTWRHEENPYAEMEPENSIYRVLTLNEIRDQIWGMAGRKPIIEVRVEKPTTGIIFQVGNYSNDDWYKQGTTRGYC